MKNEYDFSKGRRGKFYRSDANLNLPIYLDHRRDEVGLLGFQLRIISLRHLIAVHDNQ